MSVATLTSKGQLTVPADVRADLGLDAGVQVSFLRESDGSYRFERMSRPAMSLAGAVEHSDAVKTLEDMEDAITTELAEEYL